MADASTDDQESVAIGTGADAVSGIHATAIGSYTEAPSNMASAIGYHSEATGDFAVAIGSDSDGDVEAGSTNGATASGTGSVAIGADAVSPNSYEATFGNLQGEELDVNVTGKVTVHGEDLDLKGGDIQNFFDQSKCADDEAIKTVYPNGTYSCNKLSTTTEAENLSETLAAGNVANQAIAFDTDWGIMIGDSSTYGGGITTINIGKGASTATGGVAVGDSADGNQRGTAVGTSANSGNIGVALGMSSSSSDYGIAVGESASANADGAVAIGHKAESPNKYETTFGAFGKTDMAGNNVRMDVNVTGNLTVHGSGGINVTDGDVTADNFVSRSGDVAEVYSAEESYEPGTVVAVSSGEEDIEETSKRFQDVAGVVSTNPGFTLNQGEEGVKVALEGRVPVKVAEPVEKGNDLAAGENGKAVACETSDVELGEDANRTEIIEAVNSMSENQECLKASFGEALEDSENGTVEVMLD